MTALKGQQQWQQYRRRRLEQQQQTLLAAAALLSASNTSPPNTHRTQYLQRTLGSLPAHTHPQQANTQRLCRLKFDNAADAH
jgi:hypothetical protein